MCRIRNKFSSQIHSAIITINYLIKHFIDASANEDDDEADDDDAIYDDGDDDIDDVDKDSQASCGGGVQRREATCVRADGRALHPAQCAHAPMPTLVQPCEVGYERDRVG